MVYFPIFRVGLRAEMDSEAIKTGRYVGVGVDEYDAATLKRLDYAVRDVQELRALLGASFTGEPLPNPDEQTVRDLLRDLKDSMGDDPKPLVVHWAGHAIPSQVVRLRLLARDSDPAKEDGLDIGGDLGLAAAQSGANQILLIVDTCYSGNAISAASVVAAVMQARPPDAEHLWVGVLASCLPLETARDGLLGRKLLELLEDGPQTPYMRVRWSVHNERIRGDDLCDALIKEWDSEVQRPQYEGNGDAWWMLPNPLYKRGAPEQVVEHLLLAARSGARGDERSWFTGRTAEVDRVVEWVHSGRAGMHVVSGSAGTGKSAIVGRVVSLSNPQERERLLKEERAWRHADPGERSVQAHIHARGLTADRAADLLGEELVRCDVLTRQEERRNASELVGQVQRTVETGKPPPVVIVDGLDEARGQAFALAEDLLRRLAEHAVVIVSTRELWRGDESLVATLTPRGAELDLDEPAIQERGRVDMRDYLLARLAGVDERMEGAAVAEHFIHVTPMTGGSPFLLARLVADRLTEGPIDTSVDEWREQVSGSIGEALDADLARVEAHDALDVARGITAAELARELLAALTWGLGAGFPEAEWLCVARALVPDLTEDRDVLAWVLEQLGRYVVQDGEDGEAVYRLAHQSLADHLRPPYRGTREQPFDPAAQPVAEALLARYATLLDVGVPVREPAYLWRYAWFHAALAGPRGLDLLRSLAQGEMALVADVGAAASSIAEILDRQDRKLDAVSPAEEAVATYRGVAAENPAYTGNLAMALNNLGGLYGGVGRPNDGLSPAEEAVATHRALANDNPAFTRNLAMTLNNLGNRYSEVGRPQDALPPIEEALTIYRALANDNPAFTGNLAMALNNLGKFYGEVGRPLDALPPIEEAVTTYRALANDNPAFTGNLATALNNLGGLYSAVGRPQDALPPIKEAVTTYRALANDNPAFTGDLATALNNLGNIYSEVGRPQDALPPIKEAVTTYRALANDNPAFTGDLAMALNNLGKFYSEVGRPQDGLPPIEEALTIYRALANDNPAFTGDLAMALNNLGGLYTGVGRPLDALPPIEEALTIYGALANDNPAFTGDLAMALNNLGGLYSAVGRPRDALPPAEEAVTIYRALANDNPAFTGDLAMALNNLGNRYSEVGRPNDALLPAEEALTIYGALANDNPAFTGDLAMALNNLGSLYSAMGRPQDSLPPAKEAITAYRALANDNPAFTGNLAGALNNLGGLYSEVGRPQDALPPAKEAIAIYRALANDNPAFTGDLAMALNNLGGLYSAVGRPQDALPPAKEAIAIYRALAQDNPAFTSDLATALNNLDRHCKEVGEPERADAAWKEVLDSSEPRAGAWAASRQSEPRRRRRAARRYLARHRDLAGWGATRSARRAARSGAPPSRGRDHRVRQALRARHRQTPAAVAHCRSRPARVSPRMGRNRHLFRGA